MWVAQLNVINRLVRDWRPSAGLDLCSELQRKILQNSLGRRRSSSIPDCCCTEWDLVLIEVVNQVNDSLDLLNVQLEVVETQLVQFVGRGDGVALVVKFGEVDIWRCLGQLDLCVFVSVKLFDILSGGPCREGQHARGDS